MTDFLSVDTVLPAPGQGALASSAPRPDADLAAALAELDDPYTRAAVTAERSLLAALEAGCSAPVGALADLLADGQVVNEMRLRGVVGTHRRLHAGAAVHHRSRTHVARRRRGARSRTRGRDARQGCGRSYGGASTLSPTSPPNRHPGSSAHGHVTFLGAGPGDPGLLTLRAVEALASADVLIAEPDVLDVVRTHARAGVSTPELTVVDDASTAAGVPVLRDAANLVMEAARGGRRVVRAVAGDPGLDGNAARGDARLRRRGHPLRGRARCRRPRSAYPRTPVCRCATRRARTCAFVDARTASERCWTEVGASDGDGRRLHDPGDGRRGRGRAGRRRPQARHPADGHARRYHHPPADLDARRSARSPRC